MEDLQVGTCELQVQAAEEPAFPKGGGRLMKMKDA